MSKILLTTGLALSLITAPSLAWTADASSPTTLEQVMADPEARHVAKVDCDNAMWPTEQQVARHAGTNSLDEAAALRRHILVSGRAACAQGYTHVLVTFKSAAGVAVAPARDAMHEG